MFLQPPGKGPCLLAWCDANWGSPQTPRYHCAVMFEGFKRREGTLILGPRVVEMRHPLGRLYRSSGVWGSHKCLPRKIQSQTMGPQTEKTFWILLNRAENRLYLPFSDWFKKWQNWFGSKRTSFWIQVNRKMVNTIGFRFDLIRFQTVFFCVCRNCSEKRLACLGIMGALFYWGYPLKPLTHHSTVLLWGLSRTPPETPHTSLHCCIVRLNGGPELGPRERPVSQTANAIVSSQERDDQNSQLKFTLSRNPEPKLTSFQSSCCYPGKLTNVLRTKVAAILVFFCFFLLPPCFDLQV